MSYAGYTFCPANTWTFLGNMPVLAPNIIIECRPAVRTEIDRYTDGIPFYEHLDNIDLREGSTSLTVETAAVNVWWFKPNANAEIRIVF